LSAEERSRLARTPVIQRVHGKRRRLPQDQVLDAASAIATRHLPVLGDDEAAPCGLTPEKAAALPAHDPRADARAC
jgi:hypothetical protein